MTQQLKAPALVLGTPASAQEGTYQRLIEELEKSRVVEKMMVDRLVEGGMSLLFLDSLQMCSGVADYMRCVRVNSDDAGSCELWHYLCCARSERLEFTGFELVFAATSARQGSLD